MPDVATEPEDWSLSTFPEHAATIRAGEEGRLFGPLVAGLLSETLRNGVLWLSLDL